MKLLKSILFSLTAITMVTIFLSSCEKNLDTITDAQKQFSEADNQRIMDALCGSYDNCEEDIEITEHGINIQKCMHMDTESFLEYLDNSMEIAQVEIVPDPNNPGEMIEIEVKNSELTERQRISQEALFLSNDYVNPVTYYIRPSASNSACNGGYTSTIVQNAANEINNVVGCKVKFMEVGVNDNPDIIIGCDTECDYWNSAAVNKPNYCYTDPNGLSAASSGRAELAQNFPGSPNRIEAGRYIALNGDYGDMSFRQRTMTHEFLHTIGVFHTNEVVTQDGQVYGYHMPGTAATDASSIMNSPYNTSILSEQDKKLLRLVWPDVLEKPTIINHWFDAAGRLKIRFKNPDWGNNPYQRIRIYQGKDYLTKIGTGVHRGSGNFDTGILPSQFPYGGGPQWVAIRGESHRGEVGSQWSNWVYINFPSPF